MSWNVINSLIASYSNFNSGLGPSGHKFSGGQTLHGLEEGPLNIWIPLLVKTISLDLKDLDVSVATSTQSNYMILSLSFSTKV